MSKVKSVFKKILPKGIIYKLKDVINCFNNKKMLKKYKTVKKYVKGKYPYGINLIGDIQAETGLGQSMRLLAFALDRNNIPFDVIQIDQLGDLSRNNKEWNHKIVDNPKYSINLIHINTNEWSRNYNKIQRSVLDYRYNIAYWLWELEKIPQKWIACIETVDEIWAPSDFVCNCFRKYSREKNVRKIPYCIEIEQPVLYDRKYFGLPNEAFLYLIMYDLKSVGERKNPNGMISAFKMAYNPKEANQKKVGLILKVNHVENIKDINDYQRELEGYKYIYFLTDNMTREEVEALEAVSDVLISLHRSEGFGLTLAEAMYLGTPVVSTNWSATTEFTDENNAGLVDYKMIEIKKKIGPYEKGNRWADSDIKMAAEHMKKLYNDKAYYDMIKQNAQDYIRKHLNSKIVGDIIINNLSNIG